MKSGEFARTNLRRLSAALASALAFGGAGVGADAYAATGIGTADARVISPIAITPGTGVNALNFGAFSTDAAGQTVVISADAIPSRTPTGVKVVNSAAAGATFSAGKFNVTGDAAGGVATTFFITLPTTTTIAITGATSDTQRMTVSAFTKSSNVAGTAIPLPAGATGVDFYVGATVTTNANQVAGTYTGNYNVIVEYN